MQLANLLQQLAPAHSIQWCWSSAFYNLYPWTIQLAATIWSKGALIRIVALFMKDECYSSSLSLLWDAWTVYPLLYPSMASSVVLCVCLSGHASPCMHAGISQCSWCTAPHGFPSSWQEGAQCRSGSVTWQCHTHGRTNFKSHPTTTTVWSMWSECMYEQVITSSATGQATCLCNNFQG